MAYKDLVYQTATSTGTGDFTLAAATGWRDFATAFGTGSGNTFRYTIRHQSAAEWECGYGYMSDATTLKRSTVIASSNSNAAVNFSAGTKDVMAAAPSDIVNAFDAPLGHLQPSSRDANRWNAADDWFCGGADGDAITAARIRNPSATAWNKTLNLSTATATIQTNELVISLPSSNGADNVRGWGQVLPAGDFKYRAFVIPDRASNVSALGIVLKYSGDNKLLFHWFGTGGSGQQSSTAKFNTSSSWSADYATSTFNAALLYAGLWLQVERSGTNLIFSTGTHPSNLTVVKAAVSQTDWLAAAPDEIYLAANTTSGNAYVAARVRAFLRIS